MDTFEAEEAKRLFPTHEDLLRKINLEYQMIKDKTFVLYKAWRTSAEMLSDRGYDINEKDFDITFDEFRQKFCVDGTPDRDNLRILSTLKAQPFRRVLVVFPLKPPGNTLSAAPFSRMALEAKVHCIIAVFEMNVDSLRFSPPAVKIRDHAKSKPNMIQVEFFGINELFQNIARYTLGALRYKMVTPGEEEILKQFMKNNLQGAEISMKVAKRRREEESSHGAMEAKPLKVNTLSTDCLLYRYFDLQKGQFVKAMMAPHVALEYSQAKAAAIQKAKDAKRNRMDAETHMVTEALEDIHAKLISDDDDDDESGLDDDDIDMELDEEDKDSCDLFAVEYHVIV